MTTETTQLCELLQAVDQLECDVARITEERDRARVFVTRLELRAADLTRALERELHRAQACTEAAIMEGFKQGVKTLIKR